jgi:hypothetical protein
MTIFFNLHPLAAGDELSVQFGQGKIIKVKVVDDGEG